MVDGVPRQVRHRDWNCFRHHLVVAVSSTSIHGCTSADLKPGVIRRSLSSPTPQMATIDGSSSSKSQPSTLFNIPSLPSNGIYQEPTGAILPSPFSPSSMSTLSIAQLRSTPWPGSATRPGTRTVTSLGRLLLTALTQPASPSARCLAAPRLQLLLRAVLELQREVGQDLPLSSQASASSFPSFLPLSLRLSRPGQQAAP